MKILLLIALLLLPLPTLKAATFHTESMPINQVVKEVYALFDKTVIYQSKRQDLISFTVEENETHIDVFQSLALYLVEYGIEYVEIDGKHIYRDFDETLPDIQTNRYKKPSNTAKRTTFIYQVKHSDSKQFADSIKSVFQEGETVSSTKLNNTIIVTTFTQREKELKQLLATLDKQLTDFEPLKNHVIALDTLTREEATKIIQTAFGSRYKYTINPQTRKLHIKISDKYVSELRQLLKNTDAIQKQVLVDVIIAEMTTGKATQLGTQLAYQGTENTAVINYPTVNSVLGSGISALSSGLVLSLVKDKFSFILESVQTDSTTKVLSTPSLMTKEGYTASLVVGQSVPFKTGQFTSSEDGGNANNPFTTIERHDVGIKLKFTPRILSNGSIDLELTQELSSVAQSATGASDLITNKRLLETNVIVANNDIIVLGGLVENSRSQSTNKPTALSKIPLLGKLFTQNKYDYSSTNLMIFIRPRIMTADSQLNRQLVKQYINPISSNINKNKPLTGQIPQENQELDYLDDLS